MGAHKISAFHPFIFQKSGKSTIIRNLAVLRHFVSYLVFFSSIRVDPGPTNRGPTSLLALKILTPVANTGKLKSIGQMPVLVVGSGSISFQGMTKSSTFCTYLIKMKKNSSFDFISLSGKCIIRLNTVV